MHGVSSFAVAFKFEMLVSRCQVYFEFPTVADIIVPEIHFPILLPKFTLLLLTEVTLVSEFLSRYIRCEVLTYPKISSL